MKIALKCIFLLHNILEVTDFNPTLESWTDDYIDAMGSIKEGRYIDIMLCPRGTFNKCFLGYGCINPFILAFYNNESETISLCCQYFLNDY